MGRLQYFLYTVFTYIMLFDYVYYVICLRILCYLIGVINICCFSKNAEIYLFLVNGRKINNFQIIESNVSY